MQKPAEVCRSMQKQILSKSKFDDIFFLPFSQILRRLFPAFFQIWDDFSKKNKPGESPDFFLPFLTTLDVLRPLSSVCLCFCFCFVCYPAQSLSRQYKTLSPFPGGEGVKAIPRTALLLSKISV